MLAHSTVTIWRIADAKEKKNLRKKKITKNLLAIIHTKREVQCFGAPKVHQLSPIFAHPWDNT